MALSLQGRFAYKRVQIFHAKFLGSGAYGAVYKAKCDELPCAAKLIHSSLAAAPLVMQKFKQECEFFSSISHPNVVQFLGVHEDPNTGQPALLMELMDESLTNFLSRCESIHVPLHIQIDVCHDVVLALYYLLSKGIVYRDLSSNNVLLIAGKRAKITDLGVAKLKDSLQGQMTACPGSPPYMPPEALKTPPQYTEKLDVFSFGVLFLQIVTRNFPQPDQHEIMVADGSSLKGYVSIPVSEIDRRQTDIQLIPNDHPFQKMILTCLKDVPEERPPLESLCHDFDEAKESPWYKASSTCKTAPAANTCKSDMQTEIDLLKQELARYQEIVKRKDCELQEMQAQSVNQEQPDAAALTEAIEGKKVVHGLNPQLVTLLSKNKLGRQRGVLYNSPEDGSISINAIPTESLDVSVSRLLNNYKCIANQSQQFDLILVPPNCTVEDTKALIESYNQSYQQLCLSYVSDIHAIQIVGLCTDEFSQALQELESELALTIYLADGRKVSLLKGNIVNQKAEIIVSASNRKLLLHGGVAGAINAASKNKVQQRANVYLSQHGNLEESQVAVTEAGGDLLCQWVIHAVGPECAGNRHTPNSSQRVLRKAVENSLTKAEELKALSIAFPPISTGHFCMNSKLAANAIINSIIDHNYTNSKCLRIISIVIIDPPTFSVFKDVFQERNKDIMSSAGQGLDLSSNESLLPKQSGCRQQ